MPDLEKVIKGLECCKDINKLDCDNCPHTYNARSDRCECTAEMAFDALELLKARQWVSVKDRLPDNKSRYLCACFDYVTKTYWIDVLWRVSGSWWARLSTMGTDKDYDEYRR